MNRGMMERRFIMGPDYAYYVFLSGGLHSAPTGLTLPI